MKLIKTQKVSAAIISSDACLSYLGCFQLVEDALTELTGMLKIDGISEKEIYNALWVFAKTKIKFFKRILWNEEFVITAFISSKSLAKIYFDIEAKTGDDLVFYARVEACALDISTQRIRKLNTVGVGDDMQAESASMDILFDNLIFENLLPIENVRVRSTNIDMSHHTNNLEYLRFILNTYSVGELETKHFKEMQVAYCSQSFENDILQVSKSSAKNKDIIVLQKDGKPVVNCEILF